MLRCISVDNLFSAGIYDYFFQPSLKSVGGNEEVGKEGKDVSKREEGPVHITTPPPKKTLQQSIVTSPKRRSPVRIISHLILLYTPIHKIY